MNVEAFYVRTVEQAEVIAAVQERLASEVSDNGSQVRAPLPSSYDQLLRTDSKRKVIVSPPQSGWIVVIEAKEVVDFDLAKGLSAKLRTDAIVVQLSESVGARGIASFRNGEILATDYSEEDDDPSGTVMKFLRENGVAGHLPTFREAISLVRQGWVGVSRRIRG